MLTLIVARARNTAIGKDNRIPWHAPEDLRLFQRETTGGALIMGRRTWLSLPVRPLKNRLNCVLSSDPDIADHVFSDPQTALTFCRDQGHARIYGIGGAAVYAGLMPFADRLLITEIGVTIPDADTFFPDPDPDQWFECATMALRRDDPPCMLHELLRRR